MRSRLLQLVRSGVDGRSDDDGAGFWDRISGRQYTGRHAEAGGVTRQEQEDAIEEVQQQVEELEEH
jgi:hypothetical protein